MKDIWLIRHAESVMNTKPEYIGGQSNDTPLSENGKEQARKLGHYLVNMMASGDIWSNTGPSLGELHKSKFYSSFANRAINTGQIAMELIGADANELNMSVGFLELDQGAWEGQLRSDVYNDRVMQLIECQGIEFCPPYGESQEMVGIRMQRAIIDILFTEMDNNERCIIFTHGIAIKALIQRLFQMNESQIYLGTIDNCSITRFVVDNEGRYRLIWWNNNTQV